MCQIVLLKIFQDVPRAFWPLFGKTGQKTKEAFDKIDAVLLKSAKKSKGNEFEFECKLYTKLLLVF